MSCPRQLTTPIPVTTTRRCAALAVDVPLLPAAALASTCRQCRQHCQVRQSAGALSSIKQKYSHQRQELC